MQVSKESLTSTSQTPVSQTPAKKGRAKGKAAIVTSEEYREELIAQKLKSMKKEKVERSKVPRKRKNSLNNPTDSKNKKGAREPLQVIPQNILPIEANNPLSNFVPIQNFIIQKDGSLLPLNGMNPNCLYFVNKN